MQRTHGSDVSGLILRSDLGYEWLCLPMEFEEKNRSFTAVPRAGFEPEKRALVWEAGDAIPRWITPDDPAPVGEEPVFRDVWSHDPRKADGEWLWPERFSAHYVDKVLKPALRAWGGSYAEAGQLQQRPAPRSGGDMQREDFGEYDELPEGGTFARGWDLAGSKSRTAKYTCGVKLYSARGKVYVVDVVRDRLSTYKVEKLMRRCAKLDGPDCEVSVPVDPGQAGLAQKRYLASVLTGFAVHFSPETGSKEVRARGFASQVEAGNVFLPRGAKWAAAYIGELVAFPGGSFSDQVDATSRAFARLIAEHDEPLGSPPEVVEQGEGE
jgi:predicted phage terminase large subunit-like protein